MSSYNKFTCRTQDPGLRRDFIGASDAPIIMGESPWCTPLQLYERKLGIAEEQYISPAMQRGIDLEPEALAALCKIIDKEMSPMRMFSARDPHMMANFDGMCDLRLFSVEIKCPMNPWFDETVPKNYYAQIQHQLYVSRLKEMMYFSYHPIGSKLIWVKEDSEYQKILVEKEQEFYARLKNFDPPPATERDYKKRDDKVWSALSEEYKYLHKFHEEITLQLKECRDQLINACDGSSCKGNGVTVSKSATKQLVDYKQAFIDTTKKFEISEDELSKYKKDIKESWRVTL